MAKFTLMLLAIILQTMPVSPAKASSGGKESICQVMEVSGVKLSRQCQVSWDLVSIQGTEVNLFVGIVSGRNIAVTFLTNSKSRFYPDAPENTNSLHNTNLMHVSIEGAGVFHEGSGYCLSLGNDESGVTIKCRFVDKNRRKTNIMIYERD